ncbi:hypothetical protein ACFL29_02170 [Patescibacteria group bacterium]
MHPKVKRNLIIGAVVVACLSIGAYFLLKTKKVPATITEFSWKREIRVQEYRTVIETGSYVPAGGREIRNYEDCGLEYDFINESWGMECDTEYEYEIERWIYIYSDNTSGYNRKPHWPKIDLLQNQRVEKRIQTYLVHLKDKEGKKHNYESSLAEWHKFYKNEPVVARVSALGVRKIVRLEQN